MGKTVSVELEGNLRSCPEGAVSSLLHALPNLETRDGEAVTLDVVKRLYHHLQPVALQVSAAEAAGSESEGGVSAWKRHWLSAVSSLIRFIYRKWVNIPQSEDDTGSGTQQQRLSVNGETLRLHHKALFKAHVDEFLTGAALDMQIAENSVLFSEAFAFVAFCRLHNVDVVLESGVYRGFSTELWSHFVEEVVAVDIFPSEEVKEAAYERIAGRQNARLVQGDGKVVLPRLIEERPKRAPYSSTDRKVSLRFALR